MLSTEEAKSLVLCILFLMTFGIGLIPVKLMTFIQRRTAHASPYDTRVSTYKRLLSFLSCFAAGVFLATCFLDLLPDVRKNLITVLSALNIVSGFPLAEFVMCIGLFFILIIEQTVLEVKNSSANRLNGVHRPLLSKAGGRSVENDEVNYKDEVEQSYSGISDHSHNDLDTSREITTDAYYQSNGRTLHSEVHMDHHSNLHHHEHDHHQDLHFKSHSPLRALLMLMALSVHSIFEGLVVGLEKKADKVLGIFAALVLHKSIICFSLGMSLVQSRLSTKVSIRSILLFSLMSPIGVAVGILISHLWNSILSNVVDGVLQGIASGTFLYITFFEVLPTEFNTSHDRLLKVLFLILGYSTVSGILFLGDDVREPFCRIISGPK